MEEKKYVEVNSLLNKLGDDLPYKGSVKRVLMQAEGVDLSVDYYLEAFTVSAEDIVVVKVNLDKISIEDSVHIYECVKDKFPNNTVLVMPFDTDLSTCSKEGILGMIKYLEGLLKDTDNS